MTRTYRMRHHDEDHKSLWPYTILDPVPLGQGAFGKVWKVEVNRGNTKEIMACKRLDRSSEEYNGAAIAREMELNLKIRHPNVLTVWRSQISADNKYHEIFMDRAEGDLQHLYTSHWQKTSRNIFRDHPSLLRQLADQILGALNYLHTQNPPIMHRDLKPENILYSRSGHGYTFKLTDFGLSAFDDGRSHRKVGSIMFMAPEMLTGDGHYQSCKVDIWSMFAVLADVVNADVGRKVGYREWNLQCLSKPETIQAALDAAEFEELLRPYRCMAVVDVHSRPSASEVITRIGSQKTSTWKTTDNPSKNGSNLKKIVTRPRQTKRMAHDPTQIYEKEMVFRQHADHTKKYQESIAGRQGSRHKRLDDDSRDKRRPATHRSRPVYVRKVTGSRR